MAIIELRDREVRKLAFRNELMEKLAVKHEHIETEVLMLRQEKENLLQENARVLKEIEEKNDDLKQYEIKVCVFSTLFFISKTVIQLILLKEVMLYLKFTSNLIYNSTYLY